MAWPGPGPPRARARPRARPAPPSPSPARPWRRRGCPPGPPARARRGPAPAPASSSCARPTPAAVQCMGSGNPSTRKLKFRALRAHPARHPQHELHVIGGREMSLARAATPACRACPASYTSHSGTSPRSRSRAAMRTMSGRLFTKTSSPKFIVPRLSVAISGAVDQRAAAARRRSCRPRRRWSTARPRRSPRPRRRSMISRKCSALLRGPAVRPARVEVDHGRAGARQRTAASRDLRRREREVRASARA